MSVETPLLIIGAGPFGLAMAAWAESRGLECTVVGLPMAFWRSNMPTGMLLRSTCDWHLDPAAVHTIDAWLASTGRSCSEVEPLSLDFYLDYVDWFREQTGIRTHAATVLRLDRNADQFVATLDDGESIHARAVVVAIGLRYFANLPEEITSVLPADSFSHTCDSIDLGRLRNRRCLIVGGRQSAFEWAALLHEAGARSVHVSFRHDTPAFEQSDWSWVPPLVDRTSTDGGWYRRLPQNEKDAITRRMWQEGRARLEPWLAPRISHESVHVWPRTEVSSGSRSGGAIEVRLDNGQSLVVDHILLATGYKVDMTRIAFLRDGNLWPGLELNDGYPCLDTNLQSSHRGLFITGQPAVRDFGPFFGFTVSVRASAERIGAALTA
jgi:cation diffusion facilitator CzcD-associated flavoprotein CzcO